MTLGSTERLSLGLRPSAAKFRSLGTPSRSAPKARLGGASPEARLGLGLWLWLVKTKCSSHLNCHPTSGARGVAIQGRGVGGRGAPGSKSLENDFKAVEYSLDGTHPYNTSHRQSRTQGQRGQRARAGSSTQCTRPAALAPFRTHDRRVAACLHGNGASLGASPAQADRRAVARTCSSRLCERGARHAFL